MNVIAKFEVAKTYGDVCGDHITVVNRTAKMVKVVICSYNPETCKVASEVKRLKIHHRIHKHGTNDYVEEIKPYGQYGFSVFANETI